jgi:AraC-like DNA-binding protein
MLVEYAAQILPQGGRFLDLCTGSGCIAVSTLAARPDCRADAVDFFAVPLKLAPENARRIGVDARITVRRGDVLWIPIGSSYSQRCEKESLICFHLSVSGAVSPEIGVFSTQDPDGIIELFKKAERVHRRRPKNHEYLCHALLYEIIAKSGAGIMADEGKLPPLLAPAVEYINEHLFSPELSVEQAASAAHVSRSYFNRLFKASFGETPAHYISRRRIERAKQFLTVGNYTNSEIAALSGFTDIKYFYAVFKKMTGMTTGKYKKLASRAPRATSPVSDGEIACYP